MKQLRFVLAPILFTALSCVPASDSTTNQLREEAARGLVLERPVLEGPVMIRESLDEMVYDSSAVLHVRANSNATSEVLQGMEVFFFTGRHPHAVAMNVASNVQPGATADTIRGMKLTTQNVGAADSLTMYGLDVRMRCSGVGASGSTMMPLWVHTEDILGGARDLVSRPIMVTAPYNLERSFASHVAITAEGPVHVTRGPLRVYRDMDPGDLRPDPLVPEAGPGDLVAEGRIFGKEGIAVPTLDDGRAKAGVIFFSEENDALCYRAPDGTLYRVSLEKI